MDFKSIVFEFMNLANQKSGFLFATNLAFVAVFAVVFFSLIITPANAATDGWHIKDDATGGECSVIGNWNMGSKTCTLSQDLSQGIIIDSDNITLDGNGHTITGNNAGNGVYLFGNTGVTIKNVNVQYFATGIYFDSSNNNTLTGNTASNNHHDGIHLYGTNNNTLTGNTASTNRWNGIDLCCGNSFNNTLTGNTTNFNSYGGIYLAYSPSGGNTLTGNTASNNGLGIYLQYSSGNNTLTGNTASDNEIGVILLSSNNNQIYKNNLISNFTQASVQVSGDNVFNLATPIGGNYWSNFDTPAEGCNDINNDSFCDAPYVFSGGQDNLPWTTENGWLAPSNNPPTLSYSQEGGYVDDGINPDEGDTNTNFMFKIVYTDADNDPPTDIRTVIFDGSPSDSPAIEVSSDAMVLDSSANAELRDGNYANGEQYALMRSFPAGSYRYRFQTSDGKGPSPILDGIADGKEQRFEVTENQPPVALFTFTPQNPKAGDDVIFDASASYDPDPNGTISLYAWDWNGDGMYDEHTDSTIVNHKWLIDGSYTVALKIFDNKGASATSQKNIVVSSVNPYVANIVSASWSLYKIYDWFWGWFTNTDEAVGEIDEWLRDQNGDGKPDPDSQPFKWLLGTRCSSAKEIVQKNCVIKALNNEIKADSGITYLEYIMKVIREEQMVSEAFKKAGGQYYPPAQLLWEIFVPNPFIAKLLSNNPATSEGVQQLINAALELKGFSGVITKLSIGSSALSWTTEALRLHENLEKIDKLAYGNALSAYFGNRLIGCASGCSPEEAWIGSDFMPRNILLTTGMSSATLDETKIKFEEWYKKYYANIDYQYYQQTNWNPLNGISPKLKQETRANIKSLIILTIKNIIK